MKVFDTSTIEQGVSALVKMRGYRPFEYSGKWFLVQKKHETVAVRTKKAATNHSAGIHPIYLVS